MNKKDVGIGRSGTRLLTLDELISLLKSEFANTKGHVAILTTLESGGSDKSTMQSITLSKIIEP